MPKQTSKFKNKHLLHSDEEDLQSQDDSNITKLKRKKRQTKPGD